MSGIFPKQNYGYDDSLVESCTSNVSGIFFDLSPSTHTILSFVPNKENQMHYNYEIHSSSFVRNIITKGSSKNMSCVVK